MGGEHLGEDRYRLLYLAAPEFSNSVNDQKIDTQLNL